MSDRGDPQHEPESLAGLHFPLDEQAGPARTLSPAALRGMVASAVDAWPGPELHEPPSPDPTSSGGTPHAPPAPPAAPSGLAIKPFLLGAAVATTTCLATVATMLWLTREPQGARDPAPVAPAATHTAASTPDDAPDGHDTANTVGNTADDDSALEDTDNEETDTDATLEETDDTVSGAAQEGAGSEAPTHPRRSADARVAEDLLERANRLRGAGSFREADAVYAQVTREHRGTFAAYVAEVASASLHLEHLGDPRGAAQRFSRALRMRPGGALDLEALDGLARARRAIGDREGEREALRTLLSRHPGTAAAARATARLADLEPQPPAR
jgi:tetratricopeptide (TPR) repeat protein